MADLISEPVTPKSATFDSRGMGRGEPGLPTAFTWRDREYEIIEQTAAWKESQREGGKAGGELYLRRHYHKLRMSDSTTWTVYFVRQTPRSGTPKTRWFLYTIEQEAGEVANKHRGS